MLSHSKTSVGQPAVKTLVDLTLIGLTVFITGLISLIGLWLWFDYQADPGHSYLTIISRSLVKGLPLSMQAALGQQARLMGLPLAGETMAYWFMARIGGIMAYLLLWLSTIWGLIFSTKVTEKLIPAPIIYGLHEFLAILAIGFAALHALVLLGDRYIQFNIFQVMIPFMAPYRPFWSGIGVIAFYLSAGLTASFYVRRYIGHRVWRALHYLTFVAFILALGHGLMAGTDSQAWPMTLLYLITGLSTLFLIYFRLLTVPGQV